MMQMILLIIFSLFQLNPDIIVQCQRSSNTRLFFRYQTPNTLLCEADCPYPMICIPEMRVLDESVSNMTETFGRLVIVKKSGLFIALCTLRDMEKQQSTKLWNIETFISRFSKHRSYRPDLLRISPAKSNAKFHSRPLLNPQIRESNVNGEQAVSCSILYPLNAPQELRMFRRSNYRRAYHHLLSMNDLNVTAQLAEKERRFVTVTYRYRIRKPSFGVSYDCIAIDKYSKMFKTVSFDREDYYRSRYPRVYYQSDSPYYGYTTGDYRNRKNFSTDYSNRPYYSGRNRRRNGVNNYNEWTTPGYNGYKNKDYYGTRYPRGYYQSDSPNYGYTTGDYNRNRKKYNPDYTDRPYYYGRNRRRYGNYNNEWTTPGYNFRNRNHRGRRNRWSFGNSNYGWSTPGYNRYRKRDYYGRNKWLRYYAGLTTPGYNRYRNRDIYETKEPQNGFTTPPGNGEESSDNSYISENYATNGPRVTPFYYPNTGFTAAGDDKDSSSNSNQY